MLLSHWNHELRETGREKEWGGKRGKQTSLLWEVLENFPLVSQHCSPRRMRWFCLWLELQIFSLEHGGRFPSGSGVFGTKVQSWVWLWLVCSLPRDSVCYDAADFFWRPFSAGMCGRVRASMRAHACSPLHCVREWFWMFSCVWVHTHLSLCEIVALDAQLCMCVYTLTPHCVREWLWVPSDTFFFISTLKTKFLPVQKNKDRHSGLNKAHFYP